MAKSEVGQAITFLGLLGTSPSKANGFTLLVSLPGEKRERSMVGPIASYLDQNSLSYKKMGKLIGRLSFAQTLLFGKFART